MGTVGSLFTGCGGLDLGLEAAGWRTVWACENDEACRRVLDRRIADVPVHPDVRDLPYDDLEPVDLLAGGFPCQDLSYAGRGAGLDGDRSALWFDYARAIRVLRPRLVLVENVPGLATRGLGRVVYDLAEAGYVGSWLRLGAAELGAPHRRDRIFLLAADAGGERRPRRRGSDPRCATRGGGDGRADAQGFGAPAADADDSGRGEHGRAEPARAEHAAAQRGRADAAADAAGGRRRRGQARHRGDVRVGSPTERHEGVAHAALDAAAQAAADADGRGWGAGPGSGRSEAVGAEPAGGGAARPAADAGGEPGQSGGGRRAEGSLGTWPGSAQRDRGGFDGSAEPGQAVAAAADADGAGREAERLERGRGAAQPGADVGADVGADGPSPVWGPYEPAIRRWEAILGRPAPRPTDARGRLNPAFVEWMLGFPDGWTEGERRTHRLRMLGNSVQVQCGEVMGQILAEALRG